MWGFLKKVGAFLLAAAVLVVGEPAPIISNGSINFLSGGVGARRSAAEFGGITVNLTINRDGENIISTFRKVEPVLINDVLRQMEYQTSTHMYSSDSPHGFISSNVDLFIESPDPDSFHLILYKDNLSYDVFLDPLISGLQNVIVKITQYPLEGIETTITDYPESCPASSVSSAVSSVFSSVATNLFGGPRSPAEAGCSLPVDTIVNINILIDVAMYNAVTLNGTRDISYLYDYVSKLYTAVSQINTKHFGIRIRRANIYVWTIRSPGQEPTWNDPKWDMEMLLYMMLFTGIQNIPGSFATQLLTARRGFSGTVGLAFLETVCEAFGLCWVIFSEIISRMILVIAHELGHLEGAPHDGVNLQTSCKRCNVCSQEACGNCSGQYIMNPYVLDGATNFSFCTQNSICKNLMYYAANKPTCITSETCGDGRCDPAFETVNNCPRDCVICGDSICSSPFENITNCGADCQPPFIIPQYVYYVAWQKNRTVVSVPRSTLYLADGSLLISTTDAGGIVVPAKYEGQNATRLEIAKTSVMLYPIVYVQSVVIPGFPIFNGQSIITELQNSSLTLYLVSGFAGNVTPFRDPITLRINEWALVGANPVRTRPNVLTNTTTGGAEAWTPTNTSLYWYIDKPDTNSSIVLPSDCIILTTWPRYMNKLVYWYRAKFSGVGASAFFIQRTDVARQKIYRLLPDEQGNGWHHMCFGGPVTFNAWANFGARNSTMQTYTNTIGAKLDMVFS